MGERAKRIVFRVRWIKSPKSWEVHRDGEMVKTLQRKSSAVHDGARLARDTYESEGTPTQLVVHNKKGRICFERSYGNDPRRSKG